MCCGCAVFKLCNQCHDWIHIEKWHQMIPISYTVAVLIIELIHKMYCCSKAIYSWSISSPLLSWWPVSAILAGLGNTASLSIVNLFMIKMDLTVISGLCYQHSQVMPTLTKASLLIWSIICLSAGSSHLVPPLFVLSTVKVFTLLLICSQFPSRQVMTKLSLTAASGMYCNTLK